VLVFLVIAAICIIVCCKCRVKERYSYSVENAPCAARTRECSIDSASTPPVDSSSDNSVKISDLVRDDLTDHTTASIHQVPIVGSQMIPMEERAQPIAEHHPDSKRVLIVGSQRVPIEDQVQLVAVPLWACGIKILMHGVESSDMDMSERRYQRPTTTPSTWVQRAMDRAEFVVCICNEEFRDDWCYEGPEMCHDVSFVRSVSQYVAGHVNHGQSSVVESKFVVVVQSEEDLRYIPASLKNCNVFVLNCEANVDRLARFLLRVPMVTFRPRIDHISSRF
jgi:hypothetical protein